MRQLARYFWLCVPALTWLGVVSVGAQTQDHPRLMVQAAPGGGGNPCIYSPDGQFALTNNGIGIALLWDATTGNELQAYRAEWPIQYLALSADNRRAITVSGIDANNTVQLWDESSGKELIRFTPPSSVMAFTGFSPDGSQVTTASLAETDEQGHQLPYHSGVKIQVWSLETGKELQHWLVQGSAIAGGALALSPDGSKLFAGNWSGPQLFDVKTGKVLQRFPSQKEVVASAEFSTDGRRVVTGSIGGIATVLDVETGTELAHSTDRAAGKECQLFVGFGDPFVTLGLAADGRGILTMNKSGTTWLWDAETGKATLRPSKPGDGASAIISPDGRRVFHSSDGGDEGVWDLETGKEIFRFDRSAIGGVGAAAFAPGGHSLMVTTDGATVRLWDLDGGKELHHFFASTEWRPRILYPEGDMNATVETVAVTPDGKRVLTGDAEGTIQLWNMETGWQLQRFKVHTKDIHLSLAFSPDGRRMLTEDANHTSVLRDAKTGWILRHFAASFGPSFSADGHRVLLGTSVWDVETGKEIQRFATPSRNSVAGRLSPDGRRMLMVSDDGATGLWDVESGKQLASLYCFKDGSWAVVDADGRFDTDKLEGNVALHWVVGANPARVLPLAAYKERYYRPRLLAHILSGEKLTPVE